MTVTACGFDAVGAVTGAVTVAATGVGLGVGDGVALGVGEGEGVGVGDAFGVAEGLTTVVTGCGFRATATYTPAAATTPRTAIPSIATSGVFFFPAAAATGTAAGTGSVTTF